MPRVEAVAVPDHLKPDQLLGRAAVVIDILRASTTIVRALEIGALCVVPVSSVDGARMIAADRPGSLLCGERGGTKPEGFHLGNSPGEYTRERVGGKACVMSTTNGTRALHAASPAHEVFVGSITNAAALCTVLRGLTEDIVLICSGTDGRTSLEDCIGAGLIVDRLGFDPDDSALLMLNAYRGAVEHHGDLRSAIGSSFHAARLERLGFGADVDEASREDTSGVVPVLDTATGEITANEIRRLESDAGRDSPSSRGVETCTRSS